MNSIRAVILTVFGVCTGALAQSEATTPAPPPAPKATCSIDLKPPSDAEAALSREEYDTAAGLFEKMSGADAVEGRAGIIRVRLAQDKVAVARALAETWVQQEPKSAAALEAMTEVHFRAGELVSAYNSAKAAHTLDVCNPRVYLMYASYEDASAYFGLAKAHLAIAHRLAPNDPEIQSAWVSTLPRKQRLAELAIRVKDERLVNKTDRARLQNFLDHAQNYSAKDCSVVGSIDSAKVPMQRIMDGPSMVAGIALDVSFNGKRRRMEIDTGASGLVLSRGAASRLGLVSEEKIESGGFGDKGNVVTSVAHVESVKIGGLEFHNCEVEILEKASALDIDGLIGGDVFRKFLLTLDYPRMEVRLDPLPARPGEKARPGLNTPEPHPQEPGAEDGDEDATAHDRYIAPEMRTWTPIYRNGHDLLLPVRIGVGASHEKLFIVDTGSQSMMISPAAAREVTTVHSDDSITIGGISGEVKKVFSADKVPLAFARLTQTVQYMTSIDLTKFSHDDGVEISGFMGAPILFRLAVHIDYRDNLMLFEYDPKHDHPDSY